MNAPKWERDINHSSRPIDACRAARAVREGAFKRSNFAAWKFDDCSYMLIFPALVQRSTRSTNYGARTIFADVVIWISQRPLQELRAIYPSLEQGTAGPSAIVLTKRRARRANGAYFARIDNFPDFLHGGEESAPNTVDEQKIRSLGRVEDFFRHDVVGGHTFFTQYRLLVFYGKEAVLRMTQGRRGDVANVNVLVRCRFFIGAVLAWYTPAIAESFGALDGTTADGDDFRMGELFQDLYHVVCDAAGAENRPSYVARG